MAKMPLIDDDSGRQVDEIEIPDEVLRAAALVEAWLKSQPMPNCIRLHGLQLAVD